jgi:hypothetical protein
VFSLKGFDLKDVTKELLDSISHNWSKQVRQLSTRAY